MGVACPSFACRLLCCVKCVSRAFKVGDARGWHTQRSRNSPRRRCVQVGFAARYFWIARPSWVSAAPPQSILSSHRLWNLFPAPPASPPLPRPRQRAPRAQHTLDKPASPPAATDSHLNVVAARSPYARSPCRLSSLSSPHSSATSDVRDAALCTQIAPPASPPHALALCVLTLPPPTAPARHAVAFWSQKERKGSEIKRGSFRSRCRHHACYGPSLPDSPTQQPPPTEEFALHHRLDARSREAREHPPGPAQRALFPSRQHRGHHRHPSPPPAQPAPPSRHHTGTRHRPQRLPIALSLEPACSCKAAGKIAATPVHAQGPGQRKLDPPDVEQEAEKP
jgi:hypothetical protein